MPNDDTPKFLVRRDLSGGQNNRMHEQVIGENQGSVLTNIVLDTAGQRSLRTGATLLENISTSAGTGLFGFEPEGGTNVLLATEATNLWYASAFTTSGFVTAKTDFTTNLNTTFTKAIESDEGDVVIVSNGTDNCFRMNQSYAMQDLGDHVLAPPLTTVLEYYRNRLWALKENKLYWSEAISSSYASAFDRDNDYYNIPVGTERGLVGIRDTGLIVAGDDSIWGLNPSITPSASTDKPEKILDIGVRSAGSMKQVADDVWFLAPDGVRGVFRTQQDKLQLGQSKPLSWKIKSEIDAINWTYRNNFDAIYFDGKYFLTLATGASSTNNQVLVAYPDLRDEFGLPAWVVFDGLNIAKFATISVNGEERLYGIGSDDAKVYRLMNGTSDNGTAIAFTEVSRAEDFGEPLKFKSGGEFKLKCSGGTGTINVYASIDGQGYTGLGSLSLAITGVTFPVTFPVTFASNAEAEEQWHLDSLGKFKRIKFKLYANTVNQVITILETIAVSFVDEYMSEDN
jgi:hypothetical protein